MNWNKQSLRTGALVILAAIVLRLICSGVLGSKLEVFAQPELASYLVYSESGRNPVEPDTTTEPTPEPTVEPTEAPTTAPTEAPTEPPEATKFTAADAQYLEMKYSCSYRPDIEALLTQTLDWDLSGDEPTVLIIHTHGTEAFMPTADSTYEETGGEFRTLEEDYNMLSLGQELKRLLEDGGIKVIHDTTYYDYPDYLESYDTCRKGMREQLEQNPSIKMVIDLHRDAAEYSDGTQWATSCTINGEESSQMMFVVGTSAAGLTHPNWQTNLSIALKLNVLMEKLAPGVTRPVNLRGQRFNHDLNDGAFIVEVGSAGNTHAQSMNAIPILAEAILELANGANY